MSVASPKSSEPSMEEILASIRRIIADDQPSPEKAEKPAPVRAEPKPAPAPVVAAPAVEDVLDLDDEPAPPAALADDDLMFVEREEPVYEPEPVQPAPQPAPQLAAPVIPSKAAPAPVMDMELLSDQTGAAVSNAFQNLAGSILAGSQRTLDDVVKDLLRPMLKVWLDDNLPAIVERLVRAEIERVARGGR